MRSKLWHIFLWLIIISILVLYQFGINQRNIETSSTDAVMSIQIQMTGKYFIGTKQLSDQNPLLQKRVSQFIQELKKNQYYRKQLSIIPVLAELSGKDAAIRELERMVANPGSILAVTNCTHILFFLVHRFRLFIRQN